MAKKNRKERKRYFGVNLRLRQGESQESIGGCGVNLDGNGDKAKGKNAAGDWCNETLSFVAIASK